MVSECSLYWSLLGPPFAWVPLGGSSPSGHSIKKNWIPSTRMRAFGMLLMLALDVLYALHCTAAMFKSLLEAIDN